MGLAVLAAIVSDVGGQLGLWRGPVFLLHKYHNFFTGAAFVEMTMLSAILSAVMVRIFRGSETNNPGRDL